MKKIAYVIVDDELAQIERLERELKKFPALELCGKFDDSTKFMKAQKALEYDLAFFDIDMPGIKGTDLISMIEKPVVFVSGRRPEYSEKLLNLQTEQDNFLYSVNKAELGLKLSEIIPKIVSRFQKLRACILLRCAGGEEKLFRYDEIQLVATLPKGDGDPRDKRLLNLEKDLGQWHIVKTKNLEDIMDMLDPAQFCQINRYCVISRNVISGYSNLDNVRLKLPSNVKDIDATQSVGEDYRAHFKTWIRQ
jgi:YesN/AraC family two-component response regulator